MKLNIAALFISQRCPRLRLDILFKTFMQSVKHKALTASCYGLFIRPVLLYKVCASLLTIGRPWGIWHAGRIFKFQLLFVFFITFFPLWWWKLWPELSVQHLCVFPVSHVCSAELDNSITPQRSAGNGCFLCRRTHNSHLISCANSPTAKLQISKHVVFIITLLVMWCLYDFFGCQWLYLPIIQWLKLCKRSYYCSGFKKY